MKKLLAAAVALTLAACASGHRRSQIQRLMQIFEELLATQMTKKIQENMKWIPIEVAKAYGNCISKYAVSRFSPSELLLLDSAAHDGTQIPDGARDAVKKMIEDQKTHGVTRSALQPFCPNDVDGFVKNQMIRDI